MTTTYQVKSQVAILTMTSPPVNSLSNSIRTTLKEGIEKAINDKGVAALVVQGAGRAFCGGAEISEFGDPAKASVSTGLVECVDLLEKSPKPVIASIHGFALGGGLEVALGCHYRLAEKKTLLGLPEVNLGLLPGAGGTQRLPRLIGCKEGANFILSGVPINGAKANQIGIVDGLFNAEGDRLTQAIQYALQKAKSGATRAVSKIPVPGGYDAEALDQIKQKISKKRKGEIAPAYIIETIKACCHAETFEEGMKVEQELFSKLLVSSESRALQHVFFAERAAAKIPKKLQAPPAKLKVIGIIGAGTMGGGIAMSCVNAGLAVVLLEVKQEFLDKGLSVIRDNYERSVKRGSMAAGLLKKRMDLITGTLKYSDLADCDLVVEAVFEDMAIKKKVFQQLDKVCKPGAILCSNTSGLDVDEIADFISRPTDFVGCHFFSPANVMKLLENVQAAKSSPRTISTAMSFGKKIGKIPVLVGNCPGFVGNRMLDQYVDEARMIAFEGATVGQIDSAIQEWGFNMGPYAMYDVVGLDLFWRKRMTEGKDNSSLCIEDALCEDGRYGQKTGAGYYKYEKATRRRIEDPSTAALIKKIAQTRGIAQRPTIPKEEILERLLFPLINEGFKILEEGIATKASDIDIVYCFGYGFPKYRGGPMKYAEEVGYDVVLSGINKYYKGQGRTEAYWKPASLLQECVSQRKRPDQILAARTQAKL